MQHTTNLSYQTVSKMSKWYGCLNNLKNLIPLDKFVFFTLSLFVRFDKLNLCNHASQKD